MAENSDLKLLITRAKAGDDNAFADLCKQYAKLIETSAVRYALMGSEYGDLADDFRQEASFALFRAAKTYDLEQSSVTFGLYAKTCVRNALVSQLRKLSAKPRAAAKGIETAQGDVEGEVLTQEMKLSFMQKVKGLLTPLEEKALMLSMEGLTPRVIAAELGTTPKVISNALFRARSKIRKNPEVLN